MYNVYVICNYQLHSIESSVINPISYYDRECKEARSELNKIEKEMKKYEKTLKNPVSNQSLIMRKGADNV